MVRSRKGGVKAFVTTAFLAGTLAATALFAPGTLIAGESASAPADDAAVVMNTTMADFTQRSNGVFPDINKNAQYLNSGNRGCNACHVDLWSLDLGNGYWKHIVSDVHLKNGTWSDCGTCHGKAAARFGNVMSENLHNLHYSSPVFLQGNGNCWSCHAMTMVPGENGDLENKLVLFDDLKYEGAFGGYPDNGYNPAMNQWARVRNFGDYYSGVVGIHDPQIAVDMDQIPTPEEKSFTVTNFSTDMDLADPYNSIDYDTWVLKVRGVNEPHDFTLAELKELPATELTGAQLCAVTGINAAMFQNIPVKGVLLSDLIDACGGLANDANAIYTYANDGWTGVQGHLIQDLIDSNAIMVYENWGHDLTYNQGGPVKIFIPATVGLATVKNLNAVWFQHDADPNVFSLVDGQWTTHVHYNNSTWFDNDGVTGMVGEPMALEGYAYGQCVKSFDKHVAQIQFSFDYGVNWVTFDVPEGLDPQQLIHFTLNWTPEKAGTYIIKVRSISWDGHVQDAASSLIVNVEGEAAGTPDWTEVVEDLYEDKGYTVDLDGYNPVSFNEYSWETALPEM